MCDCHLSSDKNLDTKTPKDESSFLTEVVWNGILSSHYLYVEIFQENFRIQCVI